MSPCRCQSLAEEVRGLREERARREGEGKEREQELQRLRAQLDETTKVSHLLQVGETGEIFPTYMYLVNFDAWQH